jgi:hypothetical protein
MYNRADKKVNPFSIESWSGYFENLFKSNGAGDSNVVYDNGVHKGMFPQSSEELRQKAEVLNESFTEAEVIRALKGSANNKAAGVDGIPMEFFKYAFVEVEVNGKTIHEYTLSGHITHIFNLVLKKGYPKSWAIGALTPVPKPKGSLENQDDYRGIAVGSALSKLYSMVMLQRMDVWAECNNLRARGQAGFRHGRGTPDNAFVLQHIVEKYRDYGKTGKPVYAAFIDFRKAYDCINRSLLWECMSSLGMHGHFLDSLISMYKDVKICVRVDGCLGICFNSEVGVKQGDPLSPCLFGLFIDRLEKVLTDLLGLEVGVRLKDSFLKVLLYADDLVLLAESREDLQKMLDALHIFCDYNKMTVNIKKSEIVVFNKKNDVRDVFHYNGESVCVKPVFIYLGMVFQCEHDAKLMAVRSIVKGRNAIHALTRRCAQLNIHNVYTKCHLFDALVKPIINYGCELWGPSILSRGEKVVQSGMREELEKLHRSFLRQILGLRRSVPDIILMNELRREPLIMSVVKQIVGFWNRIQGRPMNDLVKIALMENCDLARSSSRKLNFWAGNLNSFLNKYGYDLFIHGDGMIDTDIIMDDMKYKWAVELCNNLNSEVQFVDGEFACANNMVCVRNISDNIRTGFKVKTYLKWFADDKGDFKNLFWYNLHRFDQISAVARFRMGSHWLNIEKDRFKGIPIPRDLRVCNCCDMNTREDELHVFECFLYHDLRQSFGLPTINTGYVDNVDAYMRACMNNTNNTAVQNKDFWNTYANFLLSTQKIRENCVF